MYRLIMLNLIKILKLYDSKIIYYSKTLFFKYFEVILKSIPNIYSILLYSMLGHQRLTFLYEQYSKIKHILQAKVASKVLVVYNWLYTKIHKHIFKLLNKAIQCNKIKLIR